MEDVTSGRGHGTLEISGRTNNVHYVCQTTEVDSYWLGNICISQTTEGRVYKEEFLPLKSQMTFQCKVRETLHLKPMLLLINFFWTQGKSSFTVYNASFVRRADLCLNFKRKTKKEKNQVHTIITEDSRNWSRS